ncbi:hypothetical protein F0562_022156 [Nyssa sinensis]|uniref:Uncharacterized protein n=1 Tax=Nyssa sinensis TaxID=561372 RepID=A0A5J5BN78_9ASTE|nr:hypothetical protein F0562_022156 [Nyssa sinensis]
MMGQMMRQLTWRVVDPCDDVADDVAVDVTVDPGDDVLVDVADDVAVSGPSADVVGSGPPSSDGGEE